MTNKYKSPNSWLSNSMLTPTTQCNVPEVQHIRPAMLALNWPSSSSSSSSSSPHSMCYVTYSAYVCYHFRLLDGSACWWPSFQFFVQIPSHTQQPWLVCVVSTELFRIFRFTPGVYPLLGLEENTHCNACNVIRLYHRRIGDTSVVMLKRQPNAKILILLT